MKELLRKNVNLYVEKKFNLQTECKRDVWQMIPLSIAFSSPFKVHAFSKARLDDTKKVPVIKSNTVTLEETKATRRLLLGRKLKK